MVIQVEFVEARFLRFRFSLLNPGWHGRRWFCRHSERRTSKQVAFAIQNAAAMGRVKLKSIFTPLQCFGDAGSFTPLVHPVTLKQLSPHLAPVWEPNLHGGGLFL
jgi:hypothetical protein